MITTAKMIRYGEKSNTLILEPDEPIVRELLRKQVKSVEIRLCDGREITPEQRRKIFALIRDISLWSGHEPEYLRFYLTWDFCERSDRDVFSLSNCDMTTATEFINYLIEFCFRFDVPAKDTMLNRTDDIGKYLYMCLEYRRCAICGKHADCHHVDAVGMGANRDEIAHVGMRAIALCREHHTEAHIHQRELFEKNHIYGIKLDEYLCKKLNLRTEKKE